MITLTTEEFDRLTELAEEGISWRIDQSTNAVTDQECNNDFAWLQELILRIRLENT